MMRALKNLWILIVLLSFFALVLVAGASLEAPAEVLLRRSLPELLLMVVGYFAMRHCDACILMEDYRRRRRQSIKRGA